MLERMASRELALQIGMFGSSAMLSALVVVSVACGTSSSDNGTRSRALVASSCDSAETCLAECKAGTTSDACERAGSKTCAANDGKRCKDVGTVHGIFAKLLAHGSPSMSARHKQTAEDHLKKACASGEKDACGSGDGPPGIVVAPKNGTSLPKPTPADPQIKDPFARRGRRGGPPVRPGTRSGKRIVPRRALERLRLSGDVNIEPPNAVKDEMRRNGDKQIITSVKVCIDKRGGVAQHMTLQPTRYMRYELKIGRKIKQWRYRPYRENGAIHEACTVYTFIYRSR